MKTPLLLLSVLCAALGTPSAQQTAKNLKREAPKSVITTAPVAASVVIITAKANAEVKGEFFTLGEIAELAGRDESLKAQLASMEIGRAPLPGYTRTLSPGDITMRLRANRLEGPRIEVIAPAVMRIGRVKNEASQERMLKVALDAVLEVLGETPNTTFEPQPLGAEIALPFGKTRYVAGAYRGTPESGKLTVPLTLLVDDKPAKTVEVVIRVRRKMRVLLATRVVEPNEILGADDLLLAQMELPNGFTQPVTSLKNAIGKRAKRRLLADSPIPADALDTPPAVKARDKVTLEFVSGILRLTVTATARQNGAIGDTIRVYCEETKKEIEVVIVDSKTVHLPEQKEAE